ncbi:MAG: efflux RND transporter periplasmic adaptor subunit [Gammaproteobacteria bacterium]|nr:efflux RND transporter periplasmic adaptor subunit [Gammaproteobacteria bacterium]
MFKSADPERRGGFGALALLCLGALPVSAAQPPADKATPIIAAEVVSTSFADPIESLGTLRANESVVLTVTVTETVSALHFDDGERVDAGTLLVEMTSEEEHAQLTEARARLDEAQRQYRRVQSLANQGTAAKALLDERSRQRDTARAQLVAIESRLSDRLVKAPFAGVLGLRNLSVGALVEPGDLITTLDDDSVMKLDLSVPSVYLGALRPGLDVVATTRAFREREFSGRVHSVDSRVDPVTRSVVVRVLLPNAERLLKPGMLMQVTLLNNPRETLVIPESALMPQGREQYVLRAVADGDGHRVERRQVQIGGRRPGQVEVLGGLDKGDLVVTHGTLRARPGQRVDVRSVQRGGESLNQLLDGTPPATAATGRAE